MGGRGYVARKDNTSNWHGEDPDDWLLDRDSPWGLNKEVWECPHDALDESRAVSFRRTKFRGDGDLSFGDAASSGGRDP